PYDPEAHGVIPSRFQSRAVELERRAREGLDGQRIVRGIEPELRPHPARDPPGTELDTGKASAIEDESMHARLSEPQRCSAAAWSASDDDRIVHTEEEPLDLAECAQDRQAIAEAEAYCLDLVGEPHRNEEVSLDVEIAFGVRDRETQRIWPQYE